MANLRDLRGMKPSCKPFAVDKIRKVFQSIARVPLPDDVSSLPPHLAMLYHLLVTARAHPGCIILGYGGYATHDGFRKGICEKMRDTLGQRLSGPMSLPDLILNKSFAAARVLAQPWLAPMNGDWLPILATTELRPTAMQLLEAVFTKLVQRGLCDDRVFGEDLGMDPFTLLVEAQFDAGKNGWAMQTFDRPGFADGHDQPEEWSPVFLNKRQHDFVVTLCNEGAVQAGTTAELGLTPDELQELLDSGLVGRSIGDPTSLELLTICCRCAMLPNGHYICGEDQDGRLTRWLERNGFRPI